MCLKTITKRYNGFGYKILRKSYGQLKGKYWGGPYDLGIWYNSRLEMNFHLEYQIGFHIYKIKPKNSLCYSDEILVRVQYQGIICEGKDNLKINEIDKNGWRKTIRVPCVVSPRMRIVHIYKGK